MQCASPRPCRSTNIGGIPRFRAKRPNLRGRTKQAFGDNIYHQDLNSGLWLQADSHHSCADGTQNPKNISHDTKVDRVLISDDFIYWGGHGVEIPRFHGMDICKIGPGHKCRFPDPVVTSCIEWLRSFRERGVCGKPLKMELGIKNMPRLCRLVKYTDWLRKACGNGSRTHG